MPRSIFITATDTGAGKTWVTKHLVELGLQQGLDIQALKPIASGVAADGLNEDVSLLLASQHLDSAAAINYHTYQTPVAPALAAEIEGSEIIVPDFLGWLDSKASERKISLIEGVGGLMVPLISNSTQSWLVSDWLQAMDQAEIMLVVPLRLGCMNQLLLNCQFLATMNRSPKWIVLNDIEQNGTAEETKRTVFPFLQRYCQDLPEILCVRQSSDLMSIL